MIPPIACSILESNSQFASLHRHLTTTLLNPDASTRALSEAPTRTSTSQALHSHLLQAAKQELLQSSLSNLASRSLEQEDGKVPNLTLKQREIVGTISMILDEAPSLDLDEDDYDLLMPEIGTFHDSIREIAVPVSGDLQHQHNVLCEIASPTPPSIDPASRRQLPNSKRTLHKPLLSSTPSLSALIRPLLPEMPPATLHSSLTSLYATTLQHSSTHLTLLRTVLTHLELTTHGLHARYTKARAAHLSTVATALAKRIKMMYLRSRNGLYNTRVQTALANYQRHLEEVERGAKEREWDLRGVVEEYENVGLASDMEGGGEGEEGGGKKGVMMEVGRRYGEVLREIERVREEVQRLESGDSDVPPSRAAKRFGRERIGES